jgi:uncharacterized protein (TIGR00369 family)
VSASRETFLASTAPSRLEDDRRCFACGPDNPLGLRLKFEYGKDSASCHVVIDPQFSGWTGMLHGGIVATLLDEAMAHAAIAAGARAVTAKLEIRFRKPAPTGAPLLLEGTVERRRANVLDGKAVLSDGAGHVYAEGHSRFVAV